ncbi:MAG: hypothetical protein E6R13_04300 [Spirochaetes bacterium]|nr:MAG: hypothetical protein E6R13_04300 [Spirochaetota bacterium]
MTKEVKIKDYEQDVHLLKIALNMVGLSVNYETTDLINETLIVLKKKKGKMDISDTVSIRMKHEEKWTNYFIRQSEEDTEK